MPAAMAAPTLSGSSTSRRVTRTVSPAERPVAAAGSRIVATTFQPRAANSAAIRAPKPEEAPVMRTVLAMPCSLI